MDMYLDIRDLHLLRAVQSLKNSTCAHVEENVEIKTIQREFFFTNLSDLCELSSASLFENSHYVYWKGRMCGEIKTSVKGEKKRTIKGGAE